MRSQNRKRRERFWRRVLGIVSATIMSPLLIWATVSLLPYLTVAAQKAAVLSAGLNFPEGGVTLWQQGMQQSDTDASTSEDVYIPPTIHQVTSSQASQEPSSPAAPSSSPQPEGNRDGKIVYQTFAFQPGGQYISNPTGGLIRNYTSTANKTLQNEITKLPEFQIEKDSSEPQVLIMHTHATESYEPYERDYFDKSYNSRSTDNTKNMIRIGEEIVKQLNALGINAIQDKTLHDYPNYNGAYNRSAETVKSYLKKYPSIKVVLDVHRDAIGNDTTRTAPVTTINGKKAAQIMIICGCDGVPNHMKNLRFASLLQGQIESDYPTLTRPVMFDYRYYNQDLTTGSLLIEMGSHSNSLDQAIYSGELVGKAVGRALLKLTK